jgi:hypothetical protein
MRRVSVGAERESMMDQLAIVGLEWVAMLALFLACIVFVRYLDHRERMSMIERGLVPPARGRRPRRGSAVLRGGLITSAVGVAVTIGLYTLGYLLPAPFSAVPGRVGPWLLPGLIPIAVGLALIASYYLAPPRTEQSDDASAPDADASSSRMAAPPKVRLLDSHRQPDRTDAASS